MRPLGASDVLALWESGAQRHAVDRSALLCAWARPDIAPERIADLPLGTVTTSLLALRQASFGPRIQSHVDCPNCGERLEMSLDVPTLLQAPPDAAASLDVGGLQVRAPSLRDLAAIAHEADAEKASRLLLARCAALSEGEVDSNTMRAAEAALEAIDPNADIAIELHCAVCGRQGTVQLDAGALLWDEIEGRARTVLAEVDALARAYGWTESEILSLGTARRATYLAMVGA